MLTQKDLDEIERLIEEKLDERIKFLPTKDEFFGRMDKAMKELKAIRKTIESLTGRVSDHSDQLEDHETRITKLESTSPAT